MNERAAQYFAIGLMSLMSTIGYMNGHVTSTASIQILGSLIGVAVLTPMIKAFK